LSRLLCFAHRGASGHAPENTLAAFELAIRMGADFIELDVQLAQDELIVFHDDRLERTTNGRGTVRGKTLAELRSFDAGQGERIPLLTEVLELTAGAVGVNVELKGPGTAEMTVRLLSTYAAGVGWDRFIVSSFGRNALNEVARLEPKVPIGVLTKRPGESDLAFARSIGAFSIHPDHRFVNGPLIDRARDAGLRVIPYTVNSPREIDLLQTLGAYGVFTDYPELVVRPAPA
jgi:glycerophosphoryl diester phosphodiesterase